MLALTVRTERFSGHSVMVLVTNPGNVGGAADAGSRAGQASRQMLPGSSWAALRVANLTPHTRQLEALVALSNLPPRLQGCILNPTLQSAGVRDCARCDAPTCPVSITHPCFGLASHFPLLRLHGMGMPPLYYHDLRSNYNLTHIKAPRKISLNARSMRYLLS